ncbi:MAG: portal protein [Steroidobacteraceae bacterium]
MSDDFATLIKHQEQLAAKRTNWDSWWQDIAYRVMPASAQFTTTSMEGERRTERLFDSTACFANERFAAVMDDLLTPRTQMWHMIGPEQDELAKSQAVKEYFEEVNKLLFTMRYRPTANFASQKHKGYLSVGAFGNSCLFIDEQISRLYSGPRYLQFHMSEVFWAQNQHGVVDTLYRRFPWSAGNAFKRFGDALPEKIRNAARDNPFQEFEFLHCVRPNEDMKEGRVDYTGMPFQSWYGACDGQAIIERSGYTSWPFAIGRYILAPNETYGRSPAMAAWPAIMTMNEEKKTVLRAGQKEVDPPLLLTEDGVLEAFNMRSSALNFGALSNDGTPLVAPLKIGANIPLGLELMQLERQHIEDSFLVSIFKILAENPQMTATQVLEIAQQKATLLAPVMGQQHSEDLGPLIAREIDIAQKAGRLPEMPPELEEAGARYKIEYRSPLARAMRAQDGVAIMRTFEALPAAIQLDPDSAYVIDVKGSMRELAEVTGLPAKFIRDDKAIARILEQKTEQEQAATAAAVVPEMASAALDAAKAEQIRRTP